MFPDKNIMKAYFMSQDFEKLLKNVTEKLDDLNTRIDTLRNDFDSKIDNIQKESNADLIQQVAKVSGLDIDIIEKMPRCDLKKILDKYTKGEVQKIPKPTEKTDSKPAAPYTPYSDEHRTIKIDWSVKQDGD